MVGHLKMLKLVMSYTTSMWVIQLSLRWYKKYIFEFYEKITENALYIDKSVYHSANVELEQLCLGRKWKVNEREMSHFLD